MFVLYIRCMSDAPQRDKHVYLDPEAHRRLQVLSDECHRKMGAQVEYMIDREIKELGIIVPDVSPAPIAAPSVECSRSDCQKP